MSQHLLASAFQAHGAGQIVLAEQLFRAIPAGSPEYPDSLLGLAVIAHQCGRFPEAGAQFSKLVALRPGDAANHCNLGECLRESGRLDEALSQLNLGIALDPDQPDAFNSLGLIHHAQRRPEAAEQALRHALKLRPQFPRAMVNLGMVLQERRRLEEAADLFRGALALDPNDPMANSNLGQILVEIGRIDDLEEAERRCLHALRLTPDRPHPLNNLGNVYRAMGRHEEAVECYRKAMAVAPGMAMPYNNMGQAVHGRARYAEATEFYLKALAIEPHSARFHANYASLLHDQERLDDAIERYRHALTIDPGHAESCHGLGQVYLRQEKTELAESAFRKSLELDPGLTSSRLGLATLYTELGDFDKAEAESSIALESHPKLAEVYYQRAMHRKGKLSDDDLEKMTKLLDEKYLGDSPRSQLNFALGMVHDKRKNFEAAGRYFQAGNELQQTTRRKRNELYDPSDFGRWIDDLIETFTSEQIQRFEGAGHESRRPIFVVGLPRSGTTLAEQILASHSAVHGAGELAIVARLFQDLATRHGITARNSFDAIRWADPAVLRPIAEEYLRELDRIAPGTPFVVDKMPDNLNLLGWIRILFPNAKIIHCRRDLRDVALSCWQTCFGAIRWANDWTQIAGRFIDSNRIDAHWKSLSMIKCLDLPYESVINDPEASARNLIEYVGLDWDPNCLKFHETKRQVRTASLSQVREPIYKTSVDKWRSYQTEMRPFLEACERLGHRFEDDRAM